MSLATRCTSCGTVFRVVQDQLKVSEGWVRCGRCDAVFNALEGLFDLERDTLPEWQQTAEPGDGPNSATAFSPPESIRIAATSDSESLGNAAPKSAENPRSAFESNEVSSEAEGTEFDVPMERNTDPGPAFLCQTLPTRQASARARITMAAAALTLLLGLIGQAVHQFRDLVAARLPALRPVLTAWCTIASCSVEAVRRIEDVAVESSALTRAPGTDVFRLAVTLRNRGAMVTALPSLELSLTDSAGMILGRRSFGPHDFRNVSPRMQIGSESVLQLTLAAGNATVSGYTVEIFYP